MAVQLCEYTEKNPLNVHFKWVNWVNNIYLCLNKAVKKRKEREWGDKVLGINNEE